MLQNKEQTLRGIRFGHEVAEEERDELRRYFVETLFWQRMDAGEIDVIYGDKGAGKSAIYLLILDNANEFAKRNIILCNAENPRGATAFRELVTDPPASELQFVSLWKLYILTIITARLLEKFSDDHRIAKVSGVLKEAGLLDGGSINLGVIVKRVSSYVMRYFKPTSAEGGITLDPQTGVPIGISGKLTFDTPTAEGADKGFISVEYLFGILQDFLKEERQRVWVLLDRLDVAFDESEDLEANALRALFRVYNDLKSFKDIELKIFLRTDIWNRITEQGFREASHIVKRETLSWSADALLNLVIRRLLSNDQFCEEYEIDVEEVYSSAEKQRELFYRFFPKQVDLGEKKPETFDWMLSRTSDGSKLNAPRELIALLNDLIKVQVTRCERGESFPDDDTLFERITFKEALEKVSEKRLFQTLYAEYPEFKKFVEKLREQKAEHSLKSLASIWGLDEQEAQAVCDTLIKVGFFEKRVSAEIEVTYWVPFIYRPALSLVQGKAE